MFEGKAVTWVGSGLTGKHYRRFGKACLGQTLKLITKILKLRANKFYNILQYSALMKVNSFQ
jgi:hypothetical protein